MRKFGSEGADIVKTKVNTRDLLTKYDKEVQDIICSKIKSNFPNHRILGEEDVAPGADAAAKATRDAFIPMENINKDGEEDPLVEWFEAHYRYREMTAFEFIDLIIEKLEG